MICGQGHCACQQMGSLMEAKMLKILMCFGETVIYMLASILVIAVTVTVFCFGG